MADKNAVRLIAEAEIATVEVTILDSRFQVVHFNVGTVDVALPPGAYLLQYKMGSSVTEVPVVLRPGVDKVTVPAPKLSTRTPAPITDSPAGERYGSFPRDRSREIHERFGEGGQLFLFIRRATKDLDVSVTGDSLFDVQLLDESLNVLVDMRRFGRSSVDGTAVACSVELTPGTYLLRYKTTAVETLEQSVVVSPGWQTMMFASSRRFAVDRLSPNFPEAAVFVVPRGAGFEPSDRNLVRAESARIALAGSCRVGPEARLREVANEASQIYASVPQEETTGALRRRFHNPMLGIYGAHLLLLNASPNWDLVRDIVVVLKRLVGNHPDVVALTLRPELADRAEGSEAVSLPPMLRNSWTLIVGESSARPGLVPAEAYAARVAKRLWGSGGWLVWHPPAVAESAGAWAGGSAPTDHSIRDALALLHKYVLERHRTSGPVAFVKQIVADRELTDTQRALLVYAITTIHQNKTFRAVGQPEGIFSKLSAVVWDFLEQYPWADRVTGVLRPDASVHDQLAPDRLVRALGVPAAALNQAIVSLAHKVSTSRSAGS